jgi:signal transduction histidine kinase
MIRRQDMPCVTPGWKGGLVSRDLDATPLDPSGKAASEALRGVARLKASGASGQELHGAVAWGLAGMAPGSSVAVLGFDPIPPLVRLLAGTGSPPLVRTFGGSARPGPFLADCARRPGTVLSLSGAEIAGQFELGERNPGLTTLLGTALPVGGSSTWILLIAVRTDAVPDDMRERLRLFATVLRSIFRETAVEERSADKNELIERAKLEWELTVDALPDIVCLLDASGRIIRANRALERWSLGPVEESPGRHFHDVLHAKCDDPGCPLHSAVIVAFQRMQEERHRAYEFQISDRRLGRVIKVRVGRMVKPDKSGGNSAAACAVLVVHDVTEFEMARRRLATMNAELEIRVAERTAELAEANRELQNEVVRRAATEEELREKGRELGALSAGLMSTQEQERKRISRELHDSVGQSLTALKYGLERATELQRQGSVQAVLEVLQKSVGSVQDTMDEIRNIALDLRPSVLDDLGAASAVAWFCRSFAASYPHIEMATELSARDSDVPARLATAIFRSLQELLNNVARHARASRVVISLRRDADQIVLEVTDDGVGLGGPRPTPDSRHGHGTRNLRERAEMTGGTFELRSGEKRGAVAMVRWRLSPSECESASGSGTAGGSR